MVAGGDGGPVRVVRQQPSGDVHPALPAGHMERVVAVRVDREDVRGGLEEQANHREGPAPRRLVEGRVVAAGGVRAVGVGVDGEEVPRGGHVALERCHVQAGLPGSSKWLGYGDTGENKVKLAKKTLERNARKTRVRPRTAGGGRWKRKISKNVGIDCCLSSLLYNIIIPDPLK